MSKLEDKLTASIKPANQRKAPSPKAKPETAEPAAAQAAKPAQSEQTAAVPKAVSSTKKAGTATPGILHPKRVWPD